MKIKVSAGSLARYSLFLAFVSFYCFTNSFNVNWGGGDSPTWVMAVLRSYVEPFYRMPNLDVTFFRRCDEYPLFILLGKLFNALLPGDNAAYKINTMVAVFGGLTVSMVFEIIRKLTRNVPAAVAGSLSLLFSHHFWLESNLGEVYTLHFFLVSVMIYALISWYFRPAEKYLYLVSFCLGLGLAHHRLIFLLLPPLAVFFVFRLRYLPSRAGSYALCLLSFLTPLLLINAVTDFPAGFTGGFMSRIWGMLQEASSLGRSCIFSNFDLREILKYFAYLFYQFPAAGFIIGFCGIFFWRGNFALRLFMTLFYLVSFALPSTYLQGIASIDRPTFYIGSYVVFSIFIGVGFDRIFGYRRGGMDDQTGGGKSFSVARSIVILALAVLPLMVYSVSPWLVRRFKVDIGPRNYLKYRDFDKYFLFPPKRWDDSARLFAEETFDIVEPNSFVYASYTPQYLLIYYQFMRKDRWDANMINADLPSDDAKYTANTLRQIKEWIYDFPVYVVPYRDPQKLKMEGIRFENLGTVYQLIPEDGGMMSDEKKEAVAPDEGYKSGEMVLIPGTALDFNFVSGEQLVSAIDAYSKDRNMLRSLISSCGRPFYIDKYEVSALDFAQFLNLFGNENEKFMGEDIFCNLVKEEGEYRPRDKKRFLPANNVTSEGAQAYALWKGKRLPDEIEWERAATNNYSTKYPWGNSAADRSLVNCRMSWNRSGFGVYASVGEFALGDNSWGVRQLAGNVMEWVRTMNFPIRFVTKTRYDFLEACGRRKSFFRDGCLLKGGSWYSYPAALDPRKHVDTPEYLRHNAYAGFRCARDVE